MIWPALFGLAYGGAHLLRRTISPVASIIVGNLVFYAGSAVALVLLIGSILLGLWSMGSNGQIALLLVIGGGSAAGSSTSRRGHSAKCCTTYRREPIRLTAIWAEQAACRAPLASFGHDTI